MAHAVPLGGLEAGAVVAEIVEIGARGDRVVGMAADRAVEVELAEEAAVDRVGEVAWVGHLAGVDDAELPAGTGGMGAHAGGGERWHRGRDGVEYRDRGAKLALGEPGQGHAVHAAAHGDRQSLEAGKHLREGGGHPCSISRRRAARAA